MISCTYGDEAIRKFAICNFILKLSFTGRDGELRWEFAGPNRDKNNVQILDLSLFSEN